MRAGNLGSALQGLIDNNGLSISGLGIPLITIIRNRRINSSAQLSLTLAHAPWHFTVLAQTAASYKLFAIDS